MESSAKLREWMGSISESLNDQVWFQELKTKWEELDPQSKLYLKFAGVGGGIIFVFVMIISFIWSVHSLKRELSEKQALLNQIQNANDEIYRLRSSVPGGGGGRAAEGDETPWHAYFENMAPASGIDKSSVTVASEKPGASGDQSKEVLIELQVKHISIKQLVRYALALESGQRPVKLRNLLIDTKGDPTGYLDATFAVSAFTVVPQP
jgi:hypothetical protein